MCTHMETFDVRPGLLALLYGRIHRSVKKFCRDPPDRAARAPHAVHPAAAPGASAPEPWNTVPVYHKSFNKRSTRYT